MGTFQEVEINMSNVSLEEGFEMFQNGALYSIGYGYRTRGQVIPGRHWTATWVNTQGMGNHGQAYAKPVSSEARKLVRKHVTDQWVQMGLTPTQAQKLYTENILWKYELVTRIPTALKDKAVMEAFAEFPGVGPGMHNQWYVRWRHVVSNVLKDLSWHRRAELIRAALLLESE